MRTPAVSGQFYPRGKNDLRNEISRCFANIKTKERAAIGAVVPHAGYMYSGRTAAHVYCALPNADTFILIGPNHTGLGSPVSVSSETWSTPIGEVKSDLDLIEALPKKIIDTDEIAHSHEHSIEVQLPFLQFRFRDFKIVSICMGIQDEETALEVGTEISVAVRKLKKKVVIIASSDFSHYKPEKIAREDDAYFIEPILALDTGKFYRHLYERAANVCGYGPIAAMLTASKNLGAKRVALLDYSTSGDTTKDLSAVVGYAGIVVE